MTFQIYVDEGGKYRWRLVADNGQTVASSGESFSDQASARAQAENVRDKAGSATVEDV